MPTTRKQQGFTLIEVVLVLAIGGLVFLLAFLAFQQVSINRRDTQRRSDAARFVAELQNYYSNTGQYPTDSLNTGTVCSDTPPANTFNAFVLAHLCPGNGFKAPKATSYGPNYVINAPSTTPTLDRVRYKTGEDCAGDAGSFKLEIVMEKSIICRDSK